MTRDSALACKALLFIALLTGHEAMRIKEGADAMVARRASQRGTSGGSDPAEEAFKALNHECSWSIYGCTGDGCTRRSLALDWPPPSSQSCRRTDQYMLDHNGAENFKTAAGVLSAKSKKYSDHCKGATIFNRHCARRQQQMMRAMKFIAKAQASKETMDALPHADKVQQAESFKTSLENIAGTMGENGAVVMELVGKVQADAGLKKDPKASVQYLIEMIAKLTLGSDDEQEKAREDIRNYQAAEPLTEQETQEADETNTKLGAQLSSDTKDVSEVLDQVDFAAPDGQEDLDDPDLYPDLATNRSALIQVQSKALAANVIAFILLAILVTCVVVWAVLEVIAAIITWALVAILGCGAYTVGHDVAISKTVDAGAAEGKVAKLGFTGFSVCFLKVFAFPFIITGRAAVATYNYFFKDKSQKSAEVVPAGK